MDEVITQLNSQELAPTAGGKPEQLVIFLHGLGSDGKDLISLAPEFAKDLPHAQFLAPNAPFNCDLSPFGYQWFSLTSFSDQAMYEGAQDVAPILNHYIDEMLERFGLKDENLTLIGFSQGTMMALHIALRRKKPCAAVIGYSGKLLTHEPLDQHITARPNIALIHGMLDPIVPYMSLQHAVNNLENSGVKVEKLSCPMLAHSIDFEGINFAKRFLSSNYKD